MPEQTAMPMSDRRHRIEALLDCGSLDIAIRELREFETLTRNDNTGSVVLSSALERLRQRSRRELLNLDEVKHAEAGLIAQAQELLRVLEGQELVADVGEKGPISATTPSASLGVDPVLNVLLLVHGMQSHADWFEMVDQLMTTQVPCQVVGVKYGYFDGFQFLWSAGRLRAIQRVKDEIRAARKKYPNAKISVIAHSFGTLALVHALDDPTIQVDRVLLCGSIVPEAWNFESYLLFGSEKTLIINDCGRRDVWPVAAKCLTWGVGATGSFGFGKAGVRDRVFPLSHSGFFNQSFVSQYWVPFVRDGTIIPPSIRDYPGLSVNILAALSSNFISLLVRVVVWVALLFVLVKLSRGLW